MMRDVWKAAGQSQCVTVSVMSVDYTQTKTNLVTLKVINQDHMFFADFSVNSQQILIEFCKQ